MKYDNSSFFFLLEGRIMPFQTFAKWFGQKFARQNFSYSEIFFTKIKFRQFCPTNFCPVRSIFVFRKIGKTFSKATQGISPQQIRSQIFKIQSGDDISFSCYVAWIYINHAGKTADFNRVLLFRALEHPNFKQ